MKQVLSFAAMIIILASCNTGIEPGKAPATVKDTLTYAFKASYSSDISAPADPVNAQKVLQVWKMFESMDINAMKPYFADTILYDDASGMHFHGSAEQLLSYAKKDIDGLDSMRFDISMWQNIHVNDRNEDWVCIWSAERRYPKKGKADTVLMQENWQVKEGKVVHFNQYLAKK